MKKSPLAMRHHRAAFTLIELLVVIAIIAILASMILAGLSAATKAARKTKAKLEAQAIATAIQAYDSAYGRFPVSPFVQAVAALPGNVNSPSPSRGDFTYGGSFQNASGGPTTVGTPVGAGIVLSNTEVIAILMDITNYPTGGWTINTNNQKNPQQTKFLNAKFSGDTFSSGVGTDLVYRDPWGNPYIITMDLNYDDQCNDAFYAQMVVSQQSGNTGFYGLTDPDGSVNNFRYHDKIMVWSAGPPTLLDKPVVDVNTPANTGFNKSHVLSWQ